MALTLGRPRRRGRLAAVRPPPVTVEYFQQGTSVSMAYVIHCPKFFTSVGDKMGNVVDGTTHSKLSPFQKEKLLHEFFVFFDRDKNGRLTFSDFCLLRDHICQLSGWQPGSAKRRHAEDLFLHMWHDLQLQADVDHDDVITANEWLLMWENIYKGLRAYFKRKKQHPALLSAPLKSSSSNSSLTADPEVAAPADSPEPDKEQTEKNPWPEWIHAYLQYRFNLYDRTGDGVIDEEEFVYVLTDFGVRERFSRQAWKMFTQGSGESLSFDFFCQLAEQYYLSNDPADAGNFLTGKLDFVAGEYSEM
ncbi:calexcitin-2-like isoform X2 [Amphibalanus amphitrite]|uniref:calexcitin-2-like isoform X2 n=1 Tax=Amphibalanus amphitrite TaxID=1232801 RepID=UPI001C8FF16C|nr:calexcitin-2-like isoform X2 [Amphibalanus amphitrite]